jgi:hypothetical protein
VNLLAAGQALVTDGLALGAAPFQMQAGTAVLQTNSLAYGTLFFPTPFPNGVLTAIMVSGDDEWFNDLNVVPDRNAGSSGNPYYQKHKLYFSIYGATGGVRTRNWPNKTVRINYILIGW